MEVVLFAGLQASGKTTFYRTFYATSHVLVSKDLFRNNRRPQRRQMQLIEEAMRNGQSVVVDNTNPTAEDRAPIIAMAREFNVAALGFAFESRLEECLARNASRSGKARVPDRALFVTSQRLALPTLSEGFSRLFRVSLAGPGEFSVLESNEERA